MKLTVIASSLGKDSLHRRLARSVAGIVTSHGTQVDYLDLRDLGVPLYDADVEAEGLPAGVRRVIESIRGTDGVIIASPEYNHSVSGVTKNLVDWISRGRPYPLQGKAVLAITATSGSSGGVDGLDALRRPLERVGALVTVAGFSHVTRSGDEGLQWPPEAAGHLEKTLLEWIASVSSQRAETTR